MYSNQKGRVAVDKGMGAGSQEELEWEVRGGLDKNKTFMKEKGNIKRKTNRINFPLDIF